MATIKEKIANYLMTLPKPYFSPAASVARSKIAGRGLIAGRDIKRGDILAVDRGPVVDLDFVNLIEALTGYETNLCVGWGKYILHGPIHKDFQGGYINHSCDANAGFIANGVWVALSSIKKGSEVFADYGTFETAPGWSMDCHCQSKKCRRLITADDWKIPELQERLGAYFAPYLREAIAIASKIN